MAYFSNWIVLFPVAFSLFVALRLSAVSRDRSGYSFTFLTLRLVVFLFFCFAFVSIGLRSSWLSVVWIAILVLLSIVLFWKNRRLDRSAMLLTLLNTRNHAQRQAVAEAFSEHNAGYVRRRARALCRDFSHGTDWARSLERCGIAKSAYERLGLRWQARYGESNDHGVAADWNEYSPLVVEQEVERTLGRLTIVSGIVVLIPLIALFMIFVVPTFKNMFDEFNMTLPASMRLVIAVSNDFRGWGWSSLFTLLPVAVMVLLGLGVTLWIFPPISRLPVIRWFFQDYYRQLGFAALARVCALERDLARACDATAELVPISFVAQQYRIAGDKMRGGQSPNDAFLTAGVLSRREVAGLGWGLNSHHPGWGLQQLASWKAERMLNRYSAIVQFLIVLVTLCMGLVVGAIAIGVLQSLALIVLEFDTASAT